MPKQLTAHHADFDVATIEALYKQEKDAHHARRLQAIYLSLKHERVARISQTTGLSVEWTRALIRRFNRDGVLGLRADRGSNGGHNKFLNDAHKEELIKALSTPRTDGNLWNSVTVAQWMSERCGRTVDPRRGWEYLKRCGFSLKVPRPHHTKADKEKQEAFKKGAAKRGTCITAAAPHSTDTHVQL